MTLEEEVYTLQPPGFEENKREHQVCKLKKVLYGFKQTPRAWNKLIDLVLSRQSLVKYTMEFGIYVRATHHINILILYLYVDDLIITGNVEAKIEVF